MDMEWCESCPIASDCPHYAPGAECFYEDGEDYDGMGEFDFEDYQGYY